MKNFTYTLSDGKTYQMLNEELKQERIAILFDLGYTKNRKEKKTMLARLRTINQIFNAYANEMFKDGKSVAL